MDLPSASGAAFVFLDGTFVVAAIVVFVVVNNAKEQRHAHVDAADHR